MTKKYSTKKQQPPLQKKKACKHQETSTKKRWEKRKGKNTTPYSHSQKKKNHIKKLIFQKPQLKIQSQYIRQSVFKTNIVLNTIFKLKKPNGQPRCSERQAFKTINRIAKQILQQMLSNKVYKQYFPFRQQQNKKEKFLKILLLLPRCYALKVRKDCFQKYPSYSQFSKTFFAIYYEVIEQIQKLKGSRFQITKCKKMLSQLSLSIKTIQIFLKKGIDKAVEVYFFNRSDLWEKKKKQLQKMEKESKTFRSFQNALRIIEDEDFQQKKDIFDLLLEQSNQILFNLLK